MIYYWPKLLQQYNCIWTFVKVVCVAIETIQCDLMLLFRINLTVLFIVNMKYMLHKVITYFMPLGFWAPLRTIKFQSCPVTAIQRIFIRQFHMAKDIHWRARTWIIARWTSAQLSAELWWHQYPSRYCGSRLLIWSRRNIIFRRKTAEQIFNLAARFVACWRFLPFTVVKNVSGVLLILGEMMWSSLKKKKKSSTFPC